MRWWMVTRHVNRAVFSMRGPSISVRQWNPRRILSSSVFSCLSLLPAVGAKHTAFLWTCCIFIRDTKEGGGRQIDRRISWSRAKDPRWTCSQKQRRTQYRVERGFHDRRVIYRSFKYKRRIGSTVKGLESRESYSALGELSWENELLLKSDVERCCRIYISLQWVRNSFRKYFTCGRNFF